MNRTLEELVWRRAGGCREYAGLPKSLKTSRPRSTTLSPRSTAGESLRQTWRFPVCTATGTRGLTSPEWIRRRGFSRGCFIRAATSGPIISKDVVEFQQELFPTTPFPYH
jgi:hypothetical protein